MEKRVIDNDLLLIPYYQNDEISLTWYQNPDICRQVDNIDFVYDLKRLHAMYEFLTTHGSCYYISYSGKLIGDVSLLDNGEIAMVISKEYQNLHIGRKCMLNMIDLAKEKGMKKVQAKIYSFNVQCQKMVKAIGFEKVTDEWYEYEFIIK